MTLAPASAATSATTSAISAYTDAVLRDLGEKIKERAQGGWSDTIYDYTRFYTSAQLNITGQLLPTLTALGYSAVLLTTGTSAGMISAHW